jgi:hypothetical protein
MRKVGMLKQPVVAHIGLFALTTVSWVAILSAVVVIVGELVR